MQMLTIKYITQTTCLLCFIMAPISLCSATTLFIDQFQIQPTIDETLANRITTYYSENIDLPPEQQKKEILNIDTQLEAIADTYSDNAIYWFLRGLHHKNMASYYYENKNIQLSNSHINEKTKAYEKSIKLGSKPKNKLSAAIYSTMKHGLPQDLKIEATKKEIALGGNGENDSYYWYLHWSNIDQLEKAGRKDEANKAYKTMQRELKASGADMSVYTELTKNIESKTLNKSAQQKTSTNIQAESKNPVVKKTTKEKTYDKKYIVILGVILFSISTIVAVAAYELIQKRKRA